MQTTSLLSVTSCMLQSAALALITAAQTCHKSLHVDWECERGAREKENTIAHHGPIETHAEGRNDRVVGGDRGRLDHGAGRAGVKGRPRSSSFVKTASHILQNIPFMWEMRARLVFFYIIFRRPLDRTRDIISIA